MNINTSKIRSKNFVWLFWLIVCIDLFALSFNLSSIHIAAKPLLMPALIFILTLSVGTKKANYKLILAGLLFSWLGDIFLLIKSERPIFFIAGLLSFLITHIFYIVYFLSIKSAAPSLLQRRPIYILIVVAYGFALVWLLLPYLGGLKIPVTFYAVVICSMLLCSIHSYLKVEKAAAKYFVTGAALFLLSDSLLAINKFYQPFFSAGFWIMLTYCTAQYCIVKGCIEEASAQPNSK